MLDEDTASVPLRALPALGCVVVLLASSGCPTPLGGLPDWKDTRIDHGDTYDPEPESSRPVLCASGNYVYVAWFDDRSVGINNIWLQISQDGGDTWNATDMQVNDNPEARFLAENPALACDDSSVYVVWEDDRDGDLKNKAIYFNVSTDAGGSWLPDDINLTIDDEGDWASLDPQIEVVDSHVYVSWYDGRDGAYDIFFNHSSDGGLTWLAEEQRVDRDGAGDAYSAKSRMSVDGAGQVHLVWEDLRNANNDIYYNTSVTHGDTWGGTDVRIDTDDGAPSAESFGASVSADDSGLVGVVWHDLRNGTFSDIYAGISINGGQSFHTPVRLDAGDGPGVSDSLFPTVLVQDGEVMVAFRDDRQNAGFNIHFTKSTDEGASFTAEVVVDSDEGAAHSIEPKLIAASDGTLVIAWTDLGDPSLGDWEDVLYNVSDDGGASWLEEEIRIDDDERNTARSIGLQAEIQGAELFFTWSDYREGAGDIYFRKMGL